MKSVDDSIFAIVSWLHQKRVYRVLALACLAVVVFEAALRATWTIALAISGLIFLLVDFSVWLRHFRAHARIARTAVEAGFMDRTAAELEYVPTQQESLAVVAAVFVGFLGLALVVWTLYGPTWNLHRFIPAVAGVIIVLALIASRRS